MPISAKASGTDVRSSAFAEGVASLRARGADPVSEPVFQAAPENILRSVRKEGDWEGWLDFG